MPLGTDGTTVTTSAKFIPKMWSDEVIATYKQKLVLGNLVTNISFKGKKGDTLNLPVPARGKATAKAANTQVKLIADTATDIQVLINKWFEYSKLYEDMAEMQALVSMRKFYTDDAGYALARKIDQTLQLIGHSFNGGTLDGVGGVSFEKAVIGSDGKTLFSGAANTNTGNGAALTDAGIRRMIQTLEDADINSAELSLVIPPVESRSLRGIARFTEQAFVGSGDTIKTGMLGNLYGVEIFTSTNCPWVHINATNGTNYTSFTSAAPASGIDELGEDVAVAGADTPYRVALMMHKDAMCLATQMDVRTQSQYKQEYLGTLVTTDAIYGARELRDYAALGVVVPG